MDMRDEVEQIILRSILKDGLDAVPQDYLFITKYDLKQIYFSKIVRVGIRIYLLCGECLLFPLSVVRICSLQSVLSDCFLYSEWLILRNAACRLLCRLSLVDPPEYLVGFVFSFLFLNISENLFRL